MPHHVAPQYRIHGAEHGISGTPRCCMHSVQLRSSVAARTLQAQGSNFDQEFGSMSSSAKAVIRVVLQARSRLSLSRAVRLPVRRSAGTSHAQAPLLLSLRRAALHTYPEHARIVLALLVVVIARMGTMSDS